MLIRLGLILLGLCAVSCERNSQPLMPSPVAELSQSTDAKGGGGKPSRFVDCNKMLLGTLPLIYYCWSELGTQSPLNPTPDVVAFDFGNDPTTSENYFHYTGVLVNGAHPVLFNGAALSSLMIAGRIETTGAPVFDWHTAPDMPDCGLPAAARPYFLAYDDWYGEFHRWWSASQAITLQSGAFSLTVPLDPSTWSSVYGQFGTAAPSQWNDARQHVTAIGVSLGGGCFYGHGVFVTGGTARFAVTQMTVN